MVSRSLPYYGRGSGDFQGLLLTYRLRTSPRQQAIDLNYALGGLTPPYWLRGPKLGGPLLERAMPCLARLISLQPNPGVSPQGNALWVWCVGHILFCLGPGPSRGAFDITFDTRLLLKANGVGESGLYIGYYPLPYGGFLLSVG